MAGIFQGDILIKTAIELGLDDMRKNPWLIDHILSDLTQINYVSDKYGQKQIDACKEWFANNQVDIYMRLINDKDRMPCVTIMSDQSSEKPEMKTMADQSTETVILLPNQINKPIPYVMKPFTPISYDPSTGTITLDPNTKGFDGIAPGMILVNPDTGEGFNILDFKSSAILIEPGIQFSAARVAVVPKHQFYEARVEHTFFEETYQIGCHAHGDPQVLLWLHSIVLYSILRYRESLLEANGFAESVVNSSGIMANDSYTGPGGEMAFTRLITLSGQVENSWIKSPRRFIETIGLKGKPLPGSNASKGYRGGIQIISNLNTPDFIDQSNELWTTVEDDED